MHWPQICLILIYGISMFAKICMNGEYTEVRADGYFIRMCIIGLLLYFGGFFN